MAYNDYGIAVSPNDEPDDLTRRITGRVAQLRASEPPADPMGAYARQGSDTAYSRLLSSLAAGRAAAPAPAGGGGGGGDLGGGIVDYPGITGGVNAGMVGALRRAEQIAGTRITGGGGRTHAQQVALKRAKPGLAATPGRSLHEHSNGALAIDVRGVTPRIRAALLQAGFRQFNTGLEPWHFSYGPRVG